MSNPLYIFYFEPDVSFYTCASVCVVVCMRPVCNVHLSALCVQCCVSYVIECGRFMCMYSVNRVCVVCKRSVCLEVISLTNFAIFMIGAI